MTRTPRTWPTFAAGLLAARASLRLPDEVGLAIRADRRRLGLSQRAYATRRQLSAALVARLETRAGDLKLADVIRGLDGTQFALCLCHRPDQGESPALAQWWYSEATCAYAKPPHWYAPRIGRRRDEAS
ncbi:hypothetical protein [Oryzobacter telluris]|uniref:hypothetical protein n=1 Tax=Oryzobacter telluris TaxID=3149179 RepID=UPI00370D3223